MCFFLLGILIAIFIGGAAIAVLCLIGYAVLWLLGIIAMMFGK